MEIRIGKEEFKALSSDTRINIIKILNTRNYTLSELAAKLNMSSPTIKQHLERLVNSDLIEQKDEGRKWKYYSLTRKGKKLIEPEDSHVLILLGASLIGLMFLVYMLFGSGAVYAPAGYKITQEISSFDEAEKMMTADNSRNTSGTELTAKNNVATEIKNSETENTGIITALIFVSLIMGFLIAKASEKKKIIDN